MHHQRVLEVHIFRVKLKNTTGKENWAKSVRITEDFVPSLVILQHTVKQAHILQTFLETS